MGNRRRGFTLAELIVGVVVMIVTLGVATMSLRSTDQTARREAERLVAYLYRQMDQAVRIHKGFRLTIGPDSKTGIDRVLINWGDQKYDNTPFEPSDGCSYSDNFPNGDVNYLANKQAFSEGGTITVTDAKGEKYYVIVEPSSKGGRVRLSDTPPN